MPCSLLIITIRFTCGETKILSNIKMSQNIMTRIVDVITLSETWLKNDKHLLEYVTLPCYEFAYRNRDEKSGGGIRIYIRDTTEFKVGSNISKLDDSIECLWVEIHGRKKNSACLIGVFYQPSSENNKKRHGWKKLDCIIKSKIDVERNSHDN